MKTNYKTQTKKIVEYISSIYHKTIRSIQRYHNLIQDIIQKNNIPQDDIPHNIPHNNILRTRITK